MEAEKSNALLPLDEPRVLAIREGKFVYKFTFNRITEADWRRCFDGIYYASRNDGKSEVQTLDMNTAGIELVESTLARVEGYARSLTTREDFAKIKPVHANTVAWMLRVVSASTEESEKPFDPENIEVRIDALWSQTEPGDAVTLFKGLVHRFAVPSVEHKRRFYRAGASSKIVGGSRNGTTIHGNRHGVLIDLYNQLILAVEGYSVGGRPLESPEQIQREMDAYHKTIAVQQLFIGGEPAGEAGETAAA
jgi:hypothetical protein